MSPMQAITGYLETWKGVVSIVLVSFAMVGADGRKTASQLNQHIDAQAARDSIQDALLRDGLAETQRAVDALALSQCLIEKNAVARLWLQCGTREAAAGLPTRR